MCLMQIEDIYVTFLQRGFSDIEICYIAGQNCSS